MVTKIGLIDPADFDEKRMETFADAVIALGRSRGITQEEMAASCMAISVNHMTATGVGADHCALTASRLYSIRARRGQDPKLLVTARTPPRSVEDTLPE